MSGPGENRQSATTVPRGLMRWCRGIGLIVLLGLSLAVGGRAEEPELVPPRKSYVPLSELRTLLEHEPRGVLMPRAEFEALLAQAKTHAGTTGPTTVTVVSKYAATGRIVGDQLLITVTAELEQLVDHWQVWSFPMERLAVEAATLNGAPARIGRGENRTLQLVTRGKRTHQLELTLSTELVTIGSDRAAGFALLPGAQGTFSLTVDAGKRLIVDNAELARPAAIEQPADYRVAVGGKPHLQLRITDRTTDRAADALTLATTGYGLVVAPGEVTWHALTSLQVFGRPIDQLTLSVPGYLEIADVEATGLERWELLDDPTNPQRTQIRLFFGQPFDGSRKLAVRGVMAVPSGAAWSVPPLTIENVNSHVGQVVIQYPAGVRLQVTDTTGVRRATEAQAAVSEMPEDMVIGLATQRLRFDVWREDFGLQLVTEPKAREVHAALALVLDVTSADVRLQGAVTVTPRYAPLFDVDLDVSADWPPLEVLGPDNQPLAWRVIPREPGTNRLRVTLPGALAPGSSTSLRVTLRRTGEGWPVEAESVVFPLPELVVPQANVVETAFVVRGDAELDLAAEEVTGLDLMPLVAEWERLRYQSQDTRYGARLKVTRKRAETAVESLGFYRLDRQSLAATLFARLTISGGGRRELIVSLPESVPATSRFEATGATLVEQEVLGVDSGRRQWRLRFAERVLGTIALRTRLTLPRQPGAGEQACPLLEVAGADRVHGAVVVEGGPDQRLTILATDAQAQPLAEMDPLELPAADYELKERIVAVHRTVGVGNTLTLSEQRFEKSAIPTAVCPALNLLTVVSRTGELQQQAEFQLRMSGVQQLLVGLPPGGNLWSATLNEQPVEIRRAAEGLLIPVPRDAAGEFTATLKLFYRGATTQLRGQGTLREVPPTLSVIAGEGGAQPVDVLEQTWTLSHPEETLVIETRSALDPTTGLDQPGWLARAGRWVAWPGGERLTWGLSGMAILAGSCAFLVLIYRQWGRGVAMAVGGIGALGLLIAGPCLLLPSVQQSRVAAMRVQARNKAAEMALPTSEMDGLAANGPMAAPANAAFGVQPTPAMSAGDVMVEELPATIPQVQSTPLSVEQLKEQEALESRHAGRRTRAIRAPGGGPAGPDGGGMGGGFPGGIEGQLGAAAGAAPAPAPAAMFNDFNGQPSDFKDAPPSQQFDFDADGAADMPLAEAPLAGKPAAPAKPARADQGGADRFGGDADDFVALGRSKGLLSLALAIDRPPGSREKAFRYVGGEQPGTGVPLEVDYVDRRGGVAARLCWLMAGMIVAWFLRCRSWLWKTRLLLLGIAVSLGLMPIVPVTWQPTLDGVACAVAGALLAWLLHLAGGCLSAAGCRWTKPLSILLIVGGLHGGATSADEAVPVEPFPATQAWLYSDPSRPLVADQVFLPYAKFVELYRLAHPDDQPVTPPPAGGPLLSAAYLAEVAEIDAEGAPRILVRARLTFQSDVEGQHAVALPFSGVVLKSARLNDAPAALVTSQTPWKVLLPQAGLQVLDVEFELPGSGTRAAGSFGLKLEPTPAARFAFRLPEPNLLARVNGSTTAYRKVTRDETSLIELAVDGGGDLSLAWQPEQARGGAAVVHVESVTAVSLVDAGLSASIGLGYKVRQGVIRDVGFKLPEGFRLQGVVGPDVGGWELLGDGADRRLRVFLRRNVGDATQLTIDGFLGQRLENEVPFRVPEVLPMEVTTEAGTIALYGSAAFSLKTEKLEQLTQIDATKYEPAIPVSRAPGAAQLAYRFNRRPWTLELRGSRLATQLRASVEQGVLVLPRKVQLTVRARCELSQLPRSALSLTVPAEWLVLDVQSEGLADWYRTVGDDGLATITLDYAAPRQGTVDIVLMATQPRDPAATLLAMSAPRVVGAARQQTQLAWWFEAGWTAQTADLGNWQALDATTISDALRQLRPTGAQLAFQTPELAPTPISVALTALEPRLSATSLTVITVTDVALVYGCVFQWQIDRAATDTLYLETPAWLTNRLQFQGPEIREATPQILDGETTRWTIALRGPVSGRFRLGATASLPPATELVPAPALKFLTLSAGVSTPLETQPHHVLLINTSLSQLTSDDPTLSEPVQAEGLPLTVRQSLIDQATEFVRLKTPGLAPAWRIKRYVPTAAIPAAVNLADLTTIVARDGSYRAVAVYTLKNRSRQFLAVRLPEQTRLLSILVQGQPARAVTTTIGSAAALLIPLPKTSAVDLSFPVQVIYAGKLPQGLPGRRDLGAGDLEIPAIDVVGQDESPEYGIPVARTQWTLFLPEDVDAVPLSDARRHNLNVADDRVAQESLVQVLLSDAEDLISAVDSISSDYGKTKALTNLRQLSTSIAQNSTSGLNGRGEAETQRLNEAVVKLEKSLQQQADPSVQAGETSGAALRSQDTRLQLERAVNNNGLIIMDNGNDGTATWADGGTTSEFNFIQLPALQPATPTEAAAKAAEGAQYGNSLQARNYYQQLNRDQLDRLNDELGKTKQQAQAEDKWEMKRSDGEVAQRGLYRFAAPGVSNLSDLSEAAPGEGPPAHEGRLGDVLALDFAGQQAQAGRPLAAGVVLGGQGSGGGRPTTGLSLTFELPRGGHKWVFSKAGGDAKLGVRVRNAAAKSQGLGWVWGAGWLIAAVVAWRVVTGGGETQLRRRGPLVVACLAAAGALFLASPLNGLCAAVFVVATFATAWTCRRPLEPAAKA